MGMEEETTKLLHKRMRTMSKEETSAGGAVDKEASSGVAVTATVEEVVDMGAAAVGSEETEEQIQRILHSIHHFTHQVSELLEAGRTLFKDLAADFEDHLFSIHKERVEKWEEEIQELRAHDAANEAARALLHNAHLRLLHTVRDN